MESIYLKKCKKTISREKFEDGIRIWKRKREKDTEDLTVECNDEKAVTFIRQGRAYVRWSSYRAQRKTDVQYC